MKIIYDTTKHKSKFNRNASFNRSYHVRTFADTKLAVYVLRETKP